MKLILIPIFVIFYSVSVFAEEVKIVTQLVQTGMFVDEVKLDNYSHYAENELYTFLYVKEVISLPM